MPQVLTVNVARPQPNPAKPDAVTGIVKEPTDGLVAVRAPGSVGDGLGSGLAADTIGNTALHGGDDQAVYAYAREDLDDWQHRLGRPLGNGAFGENLTTFGIDVTGALVGERWQVGTDGPLLEVTSPRTPCRTFEALLGVPGWIKTFTEAARPGAYLRVIRAGRVAAGDTVVVTHRPAGGVTVRHVFQAMLTDASLLAGLAEVDALPEDIKQRARRRSAAR